MNRKLIAAPVAAGVLLCSAAVAQADSIVLGPTTTNVNQGINNAQKSNQADPAGATTIVNRSDYAPSVSQGAANVNLSTVSPPKPGIVSGDDKITLKGGSTKINQAIDNSQDASQSTLGGNTLIINGSSFRPFISQGAGNLNLSTKSAKQGINNHQGALQSNGGANGTLIINATTVTAGVSQGVGNLNCTASKVATCTTTALLVGRL